MLNQLKILRQAGFFKDHELLTGSALMEALRKERKEQYSKVFGHGYEPEDFSHLTELLSLDKKKFLNIDLEAEVWAGNNTYVRILEAFAEASNGQFTPAGIQENWGSDEGPIQVSFVSNGQQIVFEPAHSGEWLDGFFFEIVNQEMKKVSAERFVICYGPDEKWLGQRIAFIRLTQDEMQLLNEKLGWIFPVQQL